MVPTHHWPQVVRALDANALTLFLGAGINLCDRMPGDSWAAGSPLLPNGSELTSYLSSSFGYPHSGGSCDPELTLVSQWAATTAGDAALYDELRGLFDSDYEPTSGHLLVARLIAERSDRGDGVPSLVVTTNYDDALEQAFDTYGVDHDTLWYIADEPLGGGILWYRDRAGAPSLIERVDDLGPLGMESGRTTLLKIHGTVDRAVAERDSYVITEDHYVDYLARATIEEILPAAVLRRLRRTHILFLGYSLRDWNLRVVLSHLWRERVLGYVSWAVQRDATLLEQTLWDKRGIQLLPVGLRDYLAELIRAISPSTA